MHLTVAALMLELRWFIKCLSIFSSSPKFAYFVLRNNTQWLDAFFFGTRTENNPVLSWSFLLQKLNYCALSVILV